MSPKDFEDLCRSIEGSVSKILDVVGKGIGKAGGVASVAISQAIENQKNSQDQQSSQQKDKEQNQPQQDIIARARELYKKNYRDDAIMRAKFKPTSGLTASGLALTISGGVLSVSLGMAEIAMIFAAVFVPETAGYAAPPLIVVGALLGLSIWALTSGILRLSLSGKLKAIRRIFGDRDVCSIQELSERLQMPPQKVVATAQKLIKRGLLPQGRFDDDCTCLMVTNDAYNLYLQAKSAYEQRLREERAVANAKQRANIASGGAILPDEARTFIDEGNRFIREMSSLDSAIDDVELSARIVEIETIIGQILERVQTNPNVLNTTSGIDRLNDYYLPQTVKLLAAYEELEEQPVQGENIANSRREIENTLNVLCRAYKKLLDSTFEDMSMDVSSDITVLHAILAQEGLTENPFNEAAKPDDGRGDGDADNVTKNGGKNAKQENKR